MKTIVNTFYLQAPRTVIHVWVPLFNQKYTYVLNNCQHVHSTYNGNEKKVLI